MSEKLSEEEMQRLAELHISHTAAKLVAERVIEAMAEEMAERAKLFGPDHKWLTLEECITTEGPPSDPWFVISDESKRGLKPVPDAKLIPEDEEGPDAESEEKP